MNIVFDLGNVLLHWDPRHLYRKIFADEAEMEWFLSHVCHHDWNLEQDRGRSFDAGHGRWHETLPFAIDGSLKTAEGARAVDMQAHHFTSPEALRAVLAGAALL